MADGVTAAGTPGERVRTSHTPRLDEHLIERMRSDRRGFERSIWKNALVGVLLLLVGLGLLYFSFAVVGIKGGGVAVVTLAIFPVLISLTAFADVRWRRKLLARTPVSGAAGTH